MHPTLFEIGGHAIMTYGVLTASGYLLGALWMWVHHEDMGMSLWQFFILMYCIVGGAVLGAKAGFYLVEWRDFSADPMWFLKNWRHGWVFWSGFIGTLVSAKVYQEGFNAFFAPKKRYLPPADYFGVSLPLGHVLGRLGCFAQGCCHGRPTELPWGVTFTDPSSSVKPELLNLPLHPVQLYEAAGELAIAVWIMRWLLPRIREGKFRYGTAFFGYIGLYSVLRFFTETFRGDDRGLFLSAWLSPSQWWSIGGLMIAAVALWRNGIEETSPTKRSLYF